MVVNVFISAVTRDNLSRKDAVAWINDVLKSHFTKVEEMSSGAAYCQFTHLLFGVINLKKVKFNPRNEPEVLNNWKALTTAWKDIGIDKPVEVEKLKKGKFQDNMEFLQWFYKFFHANLSDQLVNYDAIGARAGEDLPALKGVTRAPPTARSVATAPAPAPTRNVVRPSAGPRPVPSRNDTIVKDADVRTMCETPLNEERCARREKSKFLVSHRCANNRLYYAAS
uniref:Calponin-homology (CH) domain-containing protein n=1 Tax=Caenorhabditis japonica TaxID=281687 RepID=A0A8R1I0K3_CAEJA